MVTEFEKIVKQVVEEVNKKYEQIELEEAKEEGKKEVAKNLKGLHTPEEISKITGLNIETVLEL